MNVTVLGTGAAHSTGDRYQTGILLESTDRTLLVDAGNGVFQRLAQIAHPAETIDTVLLTHLHLDHVADISSIVKARVLSENPELTVIGPPGTRATITQLLAVDDLRERADLNITEIEPGTHTIAGFDVRAVKADHSAYCLAYRFGDQFTFSGDTEASPDVARLADGCEVLLHDCAYRDSHPSPSNHPTPTSLGRTLRKEDVEIETVYLTHLYPDAADATEELRSTVASYVDASVQVPSDTDVLVSSH
ncbi:MBL fold metallo-hydrolase [Natranaeroarchaeum sulfidigenes]|uniref:Metal-dependent hydrolase of the beta-lactamase superfamily n=1 Tax=Natranaeroarchaeum sulfidigenes TaxID=2784880 RepID=A0A897MHV8_9EURY|nr:MBL fold metallo-hydrolase [Natranaeroarchaeum sulfidigenes]QSG01720.1 Metal-dependent hydrolase of the beta-lactamase superfamily [Natranaeroarchaeum sulfidigenes]